MEIIPSKQILRLYNELNEGTPNEWRIEDPIYILIFRSKVSWSVSPCLGLGKCRLSLFDPPIPKGMAPLPRGWDPSRPSWRWGRRKRRAGPAPWRRSATPRWSVLRGSRFGHHFLLLPTDPMHPRSPIIKVETMQNLPTFKVSLVSTEGRRTNGRFTD